MNKTERRPQSAPREDSAGTGGMAAAVKRAVRRTGGVPAAVILLLALAAALLLAFRWAWQQRQELSRQLARQEERLARYEEVIDSLQARESEREARESRPVITSETIAGQLSGLQELVTQEYRYRNADKSESYAKWIFDWKRPLSEKSILVIYDGCIRAGVPMEDVRVEVDEERRTVTVTLPPSRIVSNEIPQESIQVIEVKNGLFNDVTFDNYNDFIAEQKAAMEQKAVEQGILERAAREAEEAVRAVLSLMPGMSGENAYRLQIK
ncbi:MAG: DUF4230 domain-containing protein [Lawsonibacter sp.]|nr:DUF4230 domain-containing protein [Lawsonibacter sp.]